MSELRRTPFYELQAAAGGRFVDFSGWELPVQYSGVIAEHRAVRSHAGLFDVSHMGELIVEGPGALDAVQYAVTNNVGKLVDGKALYTAMCVADGGIVDDLIVYREAEARYFLVVNGARVDADVAHLRDVLAPFDCTLNDVSSDWCQLALQGPAALGILAKLGNVDGVAMKPFAFVDAEVGGVAGVRVARTGYTGEDGVELYGPVKDGPALWCAVVAAGSDAGLALCGLGARDTLRLEMKYALYGHDIDLDHNPIEAGLGWVVKMKKGDFLGRAALAEVEGHGPARKLVGLKMRGRGIPRHGYALESDSGAAIGVVTSGTHSPSLGEPIAVGYVQTAHADIGTPIAVIIRGKAVPAEVVATPFFQREVSR